MCAEMVENDLDKSKQHGILKEHSYTLAENNKKSIIANILKRMSSLQKNISQSARPAPVKYQTNRSEKK